jgi:hypothetical protein
LRTAWARSPPKKKMESSPWSCTEAMKGWIIASGRRGAGSPGPTRLVPAADAEMRGFTTSWSVPNAARAAASAASSAKAAKRVGTTGTPAAASWSR